MQLYVQICGLQLALIFIGCTGYSVFVKIQDYAETKLAVEVCTFLVRIVTGFVREPTYSWKVLNSGKYTSMLTHAQIHEHVLFDKATI